MVICALVNLISLVSLFFIYKINFCMSMWLALPIFLGLFIAFGLLYYFVIWIVSLFLLKMKNSDKMGNLPHFIIIQSIEFAMIVMNIKVEISGLEKLPADEKVLIVGNHRSSFDPLITLAALKKIKLAFISKPENFKIPIANGFMNRYCFLAIDRESPRNAVSTINKAAEYIKEDVISMQIYPEGTRSKDGKLLPLKNGAFKIAKKAECTIAILGIYGTEKISHNVPFFRSVIKMEVIDILDKEYVKEAHTNNLGEIVTEKLQKFLDTQNER